MTAATATTRRAEPPAEALKARRALARKRLDVDIRLAKDYAAIAKLDAELKQTAREAGDSFKEDFGGDGYVSVAPPHAGEFKGEVPVVVTEKWLGLTEAKRKQLLESGIIVIERLFGKASSGRVTVKAL